MTTPKLSICIPTYNRAKTLRETLESILPQVEKNPKVEIVISDNASTDNTADLCREFQDRYPIIRYCPNSKNVGFDGNIVACVEKARGEYVSYFSDDDLSPPGTFFAIMRHLEQDNPTILRINEQPFFHDNPAHLVPPRAPAIEKKFEDGRAFFEYAGPIGLISTLTIRTRDARQYLDRVVYGRGTSHLDFSIRVCLLNKGTFIHAGNLTALARCEYDPWYDRLTFGAMNVARLYRELEQEKLLAPEDVRRRIHEQICQYLPRCVFNNRCCKEGIVPASELRALYGSDPWFYLCVLPLLVVPAPLLRLVGRPLQQLRRAARRISYGH